MLKLEVPVTPEFDQDPESTEYSTDEIVAPLIVEAVPVIVCVVLLERDEGVVTRVTGMS
jgi:hypothetical protein